MWRFAAVGLISGVTLAAILMTAAWSAGALDSF